MYNVRVIPIQGPEAETVSSYKCNEHYSIY